MARPIDDVAQEVARRSRGLDQHLGRVEHSASMQHLTRTDLERIYCGAFMSYITFLERSIERAFLGLLMGRFTSQQSAVRSLVRIESEQVARAVVNGGRSYVDWLPFEDHTKPRAKAFFSRGKPFTDLQAADRAVLRRAHAVRNAIAHESSAAVRRFRRECVDGLALPPNQRRPGGYLRGHHAVGQSRIQFMMAEGNAVMYRLCV